MTMPCTQEQIITHLRLNGPRFGREIVHEFPVTDRIFVWDMLREMVHSGKLILLPDIRLTVNEKRD